MYVVIVFVSHANLNKIIFELYDDTLARCCSIKSYSLVRLQLNLENIAKKVFSTTTQDAD